MALRSWPAACCAQLTLRLAILPQLISCRLSGAWLTSAAWALWAFAAFAPVAAEPAPDLQSLVLEGERLAVTLEEAAQLLADAKPRQAIIALSWHPNGKELATGDVSGTLTLWDLETGLQKRRLEDTSLSAVHSLAYSPDGRWLASGSDSGIVRLWDLASGGGETHRLDGWTVAFSPRGDRLAIGSRDGVVAILDPRSRAAEPLPWSGHGERIAALAWSPEGVALATGSWDRTVKLWNSADGSSLGRLKEDHGERVNAVSWSPSGKLLASASADSKVRIWDTTSGRMVSDFGGHRTAATAVAWHPDGHTVASASRDGTVRLWSYVAGEEVARFENYGGAVFAVTFNPSGSLLASATEEGFVGIWAFSSGEMVRRLGSEVSPVEALAFGQRGQILAVGSKGVIRLWAGAEGGESVRAPSTLTLAGDQTPRCLAVGMEGDTLAAGFQDGTVAWWRRESGEPRRFERQTPLPSPTPPRTPDGDRTYTYPVAALAISPDSEALAAGFDDGTIQLWKLKTAELHTRLEYRRTEDAPQQSKNQTLAFSPDGQRLVGGFADGSLFQWDLRTSTISSTLSLRKGVIDSDPVVSRYVSPNRVMNLLRGGEIIIWDTADNTIQRVSRLGRRQNAAAMSPGGEIVATAGSREAVVRVESLRVLEEAPALSRVLLGAAHHYWVDCRSQGVCYRYEDGTQLLRRNSSGELEPVSLKRQAPAPDLQIAEPPPEQIQIADGETASITITVRNPGPQRAVWINVRQTGLEPLDRLVFYPPPILVALEPGETKELRGQVSAQSTYEKPTTEQTDLKLVVTNAGGKHFFLSPIRVINSVAGVEWRGARISSGRERLTIRLANTGGGPFSADHVTVATPDDLLGPIKTDVFRNLSEGEEAGLVLDIPEEARNKLSGRLDFVAYKTHPPAHRWSFEYQNIRESLLDSPWFYLAMLLFLLPMAAYSLRRLIARVRRIGGLHGGLSGWVGDPKAEWAHLAIVFTDVVSSTELIRNIKTDAWAKVRESHFGRTDTLVKQYGGYVVKSTGDGRMIAFRSSIEAVNFAVELEDRPGHERIRIRVGIHVGQVQIDKADAHGPVVHLANRVMDVAEQGGVLVSSQVKADFDSAFQDEDQPYSWFKISDLQIPEFAEQGSLWAVRYRLDGERSVREDT